MSERAFLRIPTSIRAKISLDEKREIDVFIQDLSTKGLSFTVEESRNVPDRLDIRFRLPLSLKTIKARLEVMNRKAVSGSLRIGCRFSEIPDKTQSAIENHIFRSISISQFRVALNTATLLLCMDALWRVSAYLLNLYYRGAPFLKDFTEMRVTAPYAAALFAYAIVCFAAFVLSDRLRMQNFVLSISCTTLAFAFILSKVISYLGMHLWQYGYVSIRIFFWSEVSIALYAGFAILVSSLSYRRVNFLIRSHKTYS